MTNVKYIKEYNTNTPSWDRCLNNFNDSVVNGLEVNWGDMGFFVSYHAHTIPEVQVVLTHLQLRVAHMYINVTGNSFGNHKDVDDVFFWQAQGRTVWEVEGIEYNMSPGDLIFVPAGVYHNVTPLGPRIGISMSV